MLASLTAQSPLTTTFASNNSGSAGGGVYFDLTSTTDLQITQFDLNCNSATPQAVDIHVYWRVGTAFGNEGSNAGWNDGGTDQGGVMTSPTATPTSFTLTFPLCIPANVAVGIAIQMNGVGNAYTNGTNPTPGNVYTTTELTLAGGTAGNALFAGTVFSPRVVNTNVHYSLGACSVYAPPGLVGTAEAIPLSNTLSATSSTFGDSDFLRWNFADPLGTSLGGLSVVGWNFATPAVPSSGTTAGLPGFELLSGASTPVGTLFTVGPYMIGAADELIAIPSGLFSTGDSIKLQGVVLDPTHATGVIPVVVTPGVLEFNYLGAWSGSENFDSGTTTPLGWVNSGTRNWTVDANGTGSSGTGPTAANSLPNYLYCETSISHPGLFIIDTPSIPSSSAPNNLLEFQLSRIGATIATLEVQMDDGTGTNTFVTIATYTGADPGQAQGAVEWSFESIDITNGGTITPPANLIFRFQYSGTTSFTADIAIDDLSVN
jgi:hypothetical protein